MKERKVGIIDYSIGNLFSVYQSCLKVGIIPTIISNPAEVSDYDGIILPGVGAYAKSMEDLHKTGMDKAVLDYIKTGKAFFGVCLGMQLLFESSTEFGGAKGLGVIEGNVLALRDSIADKNHPVPKITWDHLKLVETTWENTPLRGTTPEDDFYFVHSFYCLPDHAKDNLAGAEYFGVNYSAVILRDNIFATQFHPEKSGPKGLMIYNNWKEIYLK
jgi:glutamine amidotransferase